MPNKNSNPDSSLNPDEEPDLGFASDPETPFGPTGRRAFDATKSGDDSADEKANCEWTPDVVPQAESPADTSRPDQDDPNSVTADPDDTWVPPAGIDATQGETIDPNKTWVPPSATTPNADQPKPEPETLDPNRTWVISDSPTTDGSQNPGTVSEEPIDPNKTWVPSGTPTMDGLPPDGEDDIADPNQTWVPSNTPTTDGLAPPDGSNVEDYDPNKTWTPSDTPTTDGLSRDEIDDDASPKSDYEKTWVPSDTPTTDGLGKDSDSFDSSSTWVMPGPDTGGPENESLETPEDSNKTWVPSTTPTTSGMAKPKLPVDLTETVDMKAGAAPSVPVDGLDDTVDLKRTSATGGKSSNVSTGNSGDIFQKTIGMRRPLDESDLPPSALGDVEAGQTIHLDLPEDEMDKGNSHATQLWTRQSGGDLNHSLTIRSRPVAGDVQFETPSAPVDKPDYQIVEKIGEGGMGAIFLANQTSLDRQLAIKTLKASRASGSRSGAGTQSASADRQRRDMFLAEALITANLVHPHIIPIHDLCETEDGLPFYSMKRVVGTPWCDRLREMSQDDNLEVLMKVCDAIAYAHHNGVVNRDLKPENVMLGEFGEVLVLDWGLAVPSSAADKKKFNSPSAPFGAGTPAYMAPELWTGPEDIIGYWSDIYLLGAILFEVITGKAPHKFSEPNAGVGNTGLWMVIDKVVRRNDIRKTSYKGELMDIALKAMETRPKNRFASVLKFQEALKEYLKHEESRRLSSRAIETLEAASGSTADTGYLGFQSAAALFEEAKTTWPENTEAVDGLRKTRLQYASLAHQKGDFDLGLQIATLEEGPLFVEIQSKLTRSRRIRNTLKFAVIAASAIIVAVGIFSFIQSREIAEQNNQIVALNGTRESLLSDITSAKEEIADAETKRKIADDKAGAAEERAIAAVTKAEEAAERVSAAEMKLSESTDKLKQADIQLAAASDKLSAADKKLEAANQTLNETEQKVADLEVKKSRSAVDLKNAQIASLIRNGDYSSALTEVERLLSDLTTSSEMASLPETERQQRTVELQARRRQLLQRAVQVKVPVQSQVTSRSGKLIVWANQKGLLQVRGYSSNDGLAKQPLAQLQLDSATTALTFSESEDTLLAAAESDIIVWNFPSDIQTILSGHEGRVTAIRTAKDFVISADETGSIRAWSLSSGKQLWSMRSSSRIVDLVLMPSDLMFVYAGSRGGESADILAYQLQGLADSRSRPTRLGQLQLPRDQNDPPRSLAISPDGQRLLISNSRNGKVLALPRRTIEDNEKRDRFPFVHATTLSEQSDESTWIAAQHQRPVNEINFSADGKRFCTASDDRTIGVWTFSDDSIQFIERLEGHGARVNGAVFTDRTGHEVASIAADRYCRFWNVERYQQDKRQLEREFQLSSTSAARHRIFETSQIAARYVPQRIRESLATVMIFKTNFVSLLTSFCQDVQTEKPPTASGNSVNDISLNVNPSLQRGAIQSVIVSDDGRFLTTGGSDGTAVIWNTETRQPITSLTTSNPSNMDTAAFDEGHDFNLSRFHFLPPDGHQLLTTGFDGNLCVWNSNTEKTGIGYQTLRMPGLGLVNAIATSADGRFVVTSSLAAGAKPGVCRVYRSTDFRGDGEPHPIRELSGFHRSEISSITINADGSLVATGGRDGRIALWSCADGRLLAASAIHTRNTLVSFLKLLNDGTILSAGYDGRLMLLKPKPTTDISETASFEIAARFQHDRIPIERVAVHPDHNRFVTISIRTDKQTKNVKYELNLWNVEQSDIQRNLLPAVVEGRNPIRISSVDFSGSGNHLAAVVDQRLQVFETDTWKVARVVSCGGSGMSDAIFAPSSAGGDDKQRVATFDGVAAHLWDLDSGAHLAAFRPLFSVMSMATSDHERPLLLTGDRSIRFFQAAADDSQFGRCQFKIEDPHSGSVNSLAFSPNDQNLFASCGSDGCVCLWRWEQSSRQAVLQTRILNADADKKIVTAKWTSDGSYLWAACDSGHVRKYDAGGIQVSNDWSPSQSDFEIIDLDIHADNRFIAVCGKSPLGGQSMACVFEELNNKDLVLHCKLEGHDAGGIRGIRFLPNSPYIVTAGTDGACLVWNWMPERASERPIQPYEAYQFLSPDRRVAHVAPINAVSVTSTGDVATVSDDGTARLWRNPFFANSDSPKPR